MENNLKLESKYRVKALFDETSSVNDVLVSYYLPLLEADGFAFYNFLLTESRNPALATVFLPLDRIVDILNYSTERIDQVIGRLELVKLLEVRADGKDRIIFCLNKPLSPEQFNASSQMHGLLSSKIGSDNINISNNLFNSLKVATASEFKSVTQEVEIDLTIGNTEATLNVNFDFSSIKRVIEAKNIDWSQFWNRELEEELKSIIIIYDIDNLALAMELIEEFATGSFSNVNLLNNLRERYPKKSEIDNIITSAETKLELLEGLSVSEYFMNKLDRVPAATELKLIAKLKDNYGLSDYQINILIDYSIIVNDGAITPNYITKIADTILKEGIDSPEKLIQHLKTSFALKKNGKTKVGLSNNKLMDDIPKF